MAIESKNLLVWVKAMSRGQALPLDASEIWESKTDADTYAAGAPDGSTVAYVGQTIKVIENGTVKQYMIDIDGSLINPAPDVEIPEVEAIPDSEIIALFST